MFAHERPADSIKHAQQQSRTRFCWVITYLADLTDWDWLYEPKPWEAHQRHAWPSQWQRDSGVYLVPKTWDGAETNYHTDSQVTVLPRLDGWLIPPHVKNWDTSWHPDPADPPYIHEFASKWHDQGGPIYGVSGATEVKYHSLPIAEFEQDHQFWKTLTECNWDYSWRPHPKDPPYIYVFGNQWWPAEKWAMVEYHAPGGFERKYMSWPRAELSSNPQGWKNLCGKEFNFDYSWRPDPGDPPYIYVFGNQWHRAEVMPTLQWTHPLADENTATKYVAWPRATLLPTEDNWYIPEGIDPNSVDKSWVPDPGAPAYIYQFGTQWQRTGGPQYRMPGATELHYSSSFRSTKTSVDPCWTVPDGVDTADFEFTWHPDGTEPAYIYQFGTQHQRTGGPQYTVPGAVDVKFVTQIRAKINSNATAIYEIDHMDGNAGQIPTAVKRVRYFDNYRDTLIRLAKNIGTEHEYVWVCSSICDYTDFDFSWHPERWQSHMLHVFASNDQKFGDTFFMHVPSFAAYAEKKELLEWYDVNFVNTSVPRRPMPVIKHTDDTQVDAVKNTDWPGPLALFTINGEPITIPTVSLWREETKTIVPLSQGASAVIVPKTAKGSIKTQLYDYPHINKTERKRHGDQPLDIVFISNGELYAEQHYAHLLDSTYNKNNIVHRVDNVNGRAAAYHAAARASTTPWFLAVFAKLHVRMDFPWDWQPDRMQQPKHYIFHAANTVNGLEYGHQAMIAYNRELVLGNPGQGLDFTLDSAHEVVPILSGVAHYTDTPWMAWRTAFREVLKLRASLPDVESEYRLNAWLTKDNTYGQWSMQGAADAVAYYDEVQGDFNALKKSYEWDWLASYAFIRHNLTPDH